MRQRILLAVLVSALLPGLSPLFAAPLIQRGIDAFHTPADGKTLYDFANNPIPAGFFCDGSKPFTGRVAFKGLSLATGQGTLWGADTVIERLDDVRLDDKGFGETRIRFRALSLVSIAPIKTSCGAFHVYASLAGRQRMTTMKIFHTEEAGGSFAAPLAGDVRVTFIPVKAPAWNAKKLEIRQRFTFPATLQPWSFARGVKAKTSGVVVVDTDGNLTPDTQLSGTSNFLAGQPPGLATAGACTCCPWPQGHIDPVTGHEHRTTTPMCPGMQNCC